MRYWAYFSGKLIGITAVSYGLFVALARFWPPQEQFAYVYPPRFGHDLGYTLGVGVWFLLSCGMLYAAIWDQRYRCRICLRRLRMPIETGSWGRMLQFGRPEIEYICTYGHGRLNVAEVQISGSENPEWTPQPNDIWSELAGAGNAGGKEDRPK
jgi:hypothetical protein